jgi:capsid assembly protease
MSSYPHLSSRLYNTPLMVLPDKAAVIERVLAAHAGHRAADIEALRAEHEASRRERAELATVRMQQRTDKPYQLTEGGVAIIPVQGTLVQRASGLDAMSGLTGYNRLERLLTVALMDREVGGILLDMDSPGGEVAGLFTLADIIHGARGEKPMWTVANELAASAAYAISAATERITAPRTAVVGSIGVIALHVDQSKRDNSQGYAYTAVYAGAKKYDLSSHEPLSDRARADLQASVDKTYGLFTAAVAKFRGIGERVVINTQAGVFDGDESAELGLIDAVSTFNDTLAELDAHVRNRGVGTFSGMRMAGHQHPSTRKESSMSETTPAGASAKTYTQAELDAATVEARTAARTRINGILACDEAKGREQVAKALALDTDLDLDAARKVLGATPVEAAKPVNALAAAMASVPNPKVGAEAPDAPAAGDEKEEVAAILRLVPAANRYTTDARA